MTCKGKATAEGTLRYKKKFSQNVHSTHFREKGDLVYSSIGLGTYLGDHDPRTDRQYEEAVLAALELGCNVFDTAINYRCMRSERSIGQALAKAFEQGYSRDEVIVSTKGGFIPFEGEPPADPQAYFRETYLDQGVCSLEEVTAGCHCMSPTYLQNQLQRSLENLGLSTVDIYYLHNPETQLSEIGSQEFLDRLRAAFEVLEEAVSNGQIGLYGTATWDAYRVTESDNGYLSLFTVYEVARQVAGDGHHFRVVQLPYNLAMIEALLASNQIRPSRQGRGSLLQSASDYDLVVMTSASILQGKLAQSLPSAVADCLNGLRTDAQRSIQFARSSPGVTTALVGMRGIEHVRDNLEAARFPIAAETELMGLFEHKDAQT